MTWCKSDLWRKKKRILAKNKTPHEIKGICSINLKCIWISLLGKFVTEITKISTLLLINHKVGLLSVCFVYFRNHSTVILKADNSQLAKLHHIKHTTTVYHLLNYMNMEDQRLQRKKDIGRERRQKMTIFQSEKDGEVAYIKLFHMLQFWPEQTRFLPTVSGMAAKARVFRWHWNICSRCQAVRETHAQKERAEGSVLLSGFS